MLSVLSPIATSSLLVQHRLPGTVSGTGILTSSKEPSPERTVRGVNPVEQLFGACTFARHHCLGDDEAFLLRRTEDEGIQ